MPRRAPAMVLVVAGLACAGARSATEAVPGTGSVEHGGAHATADRLPGAPDPVLSRAPPPVASATPAPGASLRACVDRGLAARDRNAFGDIAGTTYPHGPPFAESSDERYAYVLRRFPDLRTECEGSTPFR